MKIKKGITTHKMGKQILTFGNIEVEKHTTNTKAQSQYMM